MNIIVSSAYLAPIQYYGHLYAAEQVLEDRFEYFEKQTYRNRCLIATPQGAQVLTIPVERHRASKTPVRDIRLSDHGRWQHQHWQAIVSAYDNSPFFEYYADDYRPLYEKTWSYLADFNEALQRVTCELLDFCPNIVQTDGYAEPKALNAVDLRTVIHPKHSLDADPDFVIRPYYQVFQERQGFLPNLSIIDLLFNLGPEALVILSQSIHSSAKSSAPHLYTR